MGFPLEVTEYASDGTEVTVEVDYSDACNAFVEVFRETARHLVPVDTGYLRSTLNADTDGYETTAETICEYAQYVEYGTWKQRAQPYFEPAIEEAWMAFIGEAMIAIEDAWDQVMEEIEMIEEELSEEMEMSRSFDAGSFIGGALLGGIGLLLLFPVALMMYGFSQSIGLATGTSRDLLRDSSGGGGGGMPFIDII